MLSTAAPTAKGPGVDDDMDARALHAMEARLSRESGADSRNAETFGDATASWSFEEAVRANEEIALRAMLFGPPRSPPPQEHEDLEEWLSGGSPKELAQPQGPPPKAMAPQGPTACIASPWPKLVAAKPSCPPPKAMGPQLQRLRELVAGCRLLRA